MNKIGFCLALLSASLAPLCAQVSVEIVLDQDQFLYGESVPAAVRITNRSGQTLHLGAEANWLSFSMETGQQPLIAKNGDVPVVGAFDLESSKVAIKRVNLEPYFSLDQPGHYTVTATVRIRGWDRELLSPPKGFDVIEGSKLWERDFGVPPASGASSTEPEARKYVLQQANYIKGQIALYVRVTDPGGRSLRVVSLGRMISFSRPEAQVDRFSNLHILFQNGPRSFSYTVINPDGAVVVRQTHDYANSRPRLKPDPDGSINVQGGVRRMTANDVPKPLAPPEDTPAPPPNEVTPPKH
ncbi:conserved exported hypothetical protein [Verrucomicrobia bacterium]|nr:conserved exported hypothetical protein [Verrucomicrobiota bacterium]